MKLAITVATIVLLATACASDPVREAAWNAREGECHGGSWLYTQSKYVCASWEMRDREAENIRNTPYEMNRIQERLARASPPPK